MKTPIVFNIQKFSIHDGPGIRTTIFFKGCPLRCAWCHNPESQRYQIETMIKKNNKQETVGREYTVRELVKEAQKDQLFYEQSGGGVTLSGGEVMTQNIDFIEELVKELHRVGISVAIDTCGVAPFKNYERILPYVDLFLYDLKFIHSDLHAKYTGRPNDLVLNNLVRLNEHHANISLRLILLEGINADDTTLLETIDWLKQEKINLYSVHLLPYHEFGKDKYAGLQREWHKFTPPSEERLAAIQELLTTHYSPVYIGG